MLKALHTVDLSIGAKVWQTPLLRRQRHTTTDRSTLGRQLTVIATGADGAALVAFAFKADGGRE